jgi:hypothetical protein
MNALKVMLAAAATGFAVAFTVWATGQPHSENCPAPSARSVTSLFAPCLEQQAYNAADSRVLER